MIIAVYAPHDPRDKRMLWDYLAHVINQWQGEVVIMGDFNEVRVKSDRFGTNFNVLGANIFNSFINSTGLEEVHLGATRVLVLLFRRIPRGGIRAKSIRQLGRIGFVQSLSVPSADRWNCNLRVRNIFVASLLVRRIDDICRSEYW
ncbi:RNA-directed DNA polymerase, eukaryota [Tanacetum coccineum]|uniref:RNA-directed DNA polymerase, eukaryota n=1 Tax=Tanacetum coccineum TaxID=301880 RepID=A0ABQ4WZ19_9ASTR